MRQEVENKASGPGDPNPKPYFGTKPRLSYLYQPQTTITRQQLVEMDKPDPIKDLLLPEGHQPQHIKMSSALLHQPMSQRRRPSSLLDSEIMN